MMEIQKIRTEYDVRRLDDMYADSIAEICKENTQYYQYVEEEPTREQVLQDLHITPPGIVPSDKYYIGFFQDETLIAVMDLIDGFPEADIAYIGFFMMNKEVQGQGIGSQIIRDTEKYLKTAGKTAVRLAIEKENPQSTHFWSKNGFAVIKEVDRNGRPVLVAEKKL